MRELNLIQRAARGDVEAQSAMVVESLNSPLPRPMAHMSAEWWARLAASHGGTDANNVLASVLLIRASYAHASGERDACTSYAGEALAVLDVMANLGCGNTVPSLSKITSDLDAMGCREDAVAKAKEISAFMMAEVDR